MACSSRLMIAYSVTKKHDLLQLDGFLNVSLTCFPVRKYILFGFSYGFVCSLKRVLFKKT